MQPTAEDCAHDLLDVVPAVMQVIRSEIRSQRGHELSVLQVRSLAFLYQHPGATLSAVAEHVGLTLSSMSTQVTKLVQRNLVERNESPHDRRFVTLNLTAVGVATLETVRFQAQSNLSARCEQWSAEERLIVLQAMAILRSHFGLPAPDNISANQPDPAETE